MQDSFTGRINILQQNLHDRYKSGFPIVKELIQNADDAESTQLDCDFARHRKHAPHLAARPTALFVIDNGRFTKQNAEAINTIGASSESLNQATIGKFGLGLKVSSTFAKRSLSDAGRTRVCNRQSLGNGRIRQ